jgi:hypothetical protein
MSCQYVKMAWEKFEKTAEKFINKVIKIDNVKIKLAGGSNSNAKDLVVKKNNKEIFNIEIKEKKSQISQFVVKKNSRNKSYYLGKLNEVAKEKTKEILKHMNDNYELYQDPTQKGITLTCNKSMMYRCVENYLKEKNIKFIISSINDEDPTIISSNNFKRNFSIIFGKYRRKKSGTNDLALKSHKEAKEYLYNKFPGSTFLKEGKKLFIKVEKDFLKKIESKSNKSFNLSNFNIFLSETNDKMKFRVVRKSNTNNPTVIFSIDFHNDAKDNDLPLLEKTINEIK